MCHSSLSSIPELISHYKSSHKLQCRMCQFVADSDKVLKLHYAEVHKEDKHCFCPLTGCSYRINRYWDLKRHIETHAALNRKNKFLRCPFCEFVTFGQTQLRKHCISEHDENRPFFCQRKGCTFKAYQLSEVYKHVRLQHIAVAKVRIIGIYWSPHTKVHRITKIRTLYMYI